MFFYRNFVKYVVQIALTTFNNFLNNWFQIKSLNPIIMKWLLQKNF